jgi:hypothetical protein
MDGAYFGSSFPHMFMLTFNDIIPDAPSSVYVPRIFGFKIHSSSNCLPKGSWMNVFFAVLSCDDSKHI